MQEHQGVSVVLAAMEHLTSLCQVAEIVYVQTLQLG